MHTSFTLCYEDVSDGPKDDYPVCESDVTTAARVPVPGDEVFLMCDGGQTRVVKCVAHSMADGDAMVERVIVYLGRPHYEGYPPDDPDKDQLCHYCKAFAHHNVPVCPDHYRASDAGPRNDADLADALRRMIDAFDGPGLSRKQATTLRKAAAVMKKVDNI